MFIRAYLHLRHIWWSWFHCGDNTILSRTSCSSLHWRLFLMTLADWLVQNNHHKQKPPWWHGLIHKWHCWTSSDSQMKISLIYYFTAAPCFFDWSPCLLFSLASFRNTSGNIIPVWNLFQGGRPCWYSTTILGSVCCSSHGVWTMT